MNCQPEDKTFSQVLRAHWHVQPQRNPEFRSAVWARIEASRRAPATWSAWLRANTVGFASAAIACVVLAGAGGAWLAHEQAAQTRDLLVQRYLASIDPHTQVDLTSR